MKPTITIAATSDIHANKYSIKKQFFNQVNNTADLLLIAGDMNDGKEEQVKHFLSLVSNVKIPIVIVFGSHDANENSLGKIRRLLMKNTHITILEGEYVEYKFRGIRIGIAGAKGFAGGFSPNELRGNIGEQVLKDFKKEGDFEVARLREALKKMNAVSPDIKVAMTHVAPFKEAIAGEHVEIYPFLGNSKLGDAIKEAGVNLAVCGHAHSGPRGLKKINNKISVCNVGYSVNEKKMIWFDFFQDKKIQLRKEKKTSIFVFPRRKAKFSKRAC